MEHFASAASTTHERKLACVHTHALNDLLMVQVYTTLTGAAVNFGNPANTTIARVHLQLVSV